MPNSIYSPIRDWRLLLASAMIAVLAPIIFALSIWAQFPDRLPKPMAVPVQLFVVLVPPIIWIVFVTKAMQRFGISATWLMLFAPVALSVIAWIIYFVAMSG